MWKLKEPCRLKHEVKDRIKSSGDIGDHQASASFPPPLLMLNLASKICLAETIAWKRSV